MTSPRPRVTTLTELKKLPEGAVLMSEKTDRMYGLSRLIQVAVPGSLFAVDGTFTLHGGMRRNLPAEVLHDPTTSARPVNAASVSSTHTDEVEYGMLRKSDGWSVATPGFSLEWLHEEVARRGNSILTVVKRRPGVAPGPWVEVPSPAASAGEEAAG